MQQPTASSSVPAVVADEENVPLWNVWAEEFSLRPKFESVLKLLINEQYSLVVDLSMIEVAQQEGVYQAKISRSLRDWLTKKTASETAIQILLLTNDIYFEPQRDGERVKNIAINLEKLRATKGKRFITDQKLLQYLKENPEGPFSFGRQIFQIKTKSRVGAASVALSFWVDGSLPVDEISIPICIVASVNDPCPTAAKPTLGLRGFDSVKAAIAKKSIAYPDLALQFVALDSATTIGVLRCNTCNDWPDSKFLTWQLNRKPREISEYLSRTLLQQLEVAYSDQEYRKRGLDLYNLLFHTANDRNPAAEAFRKYVHLHSGTQPPKSIFVRMLAHESDSLFLAPLGLMVPPGEDFLGFHFRIETPLEHQDYSTPNRCLSEWVLLVPPLNPNDNDELQEARAEFEDWMNEFRNSKKNPKPNIFEDLDDFSNWVSKSGKAKSTALLLISHHEQDRIFLSSGSALLSASIQRNFRVPSLVILNACGTGKPGAWDFVRRFNERGATAIIATSIAVDARMAGLFASQIATELRDHATERNYTIGRARYDAALAVSKMLRPGTEEPYGPQVLIYMLIGNGGLKVCTP